MTPAQLRARLATLLSGLLGLYTRPNGSTTPALWVGDPPSDYKVSGLEVIVEPLAGLSLSPVHQGVGIGLEYRVTLIPRSAANALAAARRIVQALDATEPRLVPANERLGVLQQYVLTIRSQ